jgi:hypothetical protein
MKPFLMSRRPSLRVRTPRFRMMRRFLGTGRLASARGACLIHVREPSPAARRHRYAARDGLLAVREGFVTVRDGLLAVNEHRIAATKRRHAARRARPRTLTKQARGLTVGGTNFRPISWVRNSTPTR